MTSLLEAVQAVLRALDESGIRYMVVGSFAASIYGVSRRTRNMDIVVALEVDTVPKLARALGEGFYIDEVSAQEAVERSDTFHILQPRSNLKVFFFVLRDDRFSRTQFERRNRMTAWGTEACVASPEDMVLSKLLWTKITPSERQLEDVRGILREMRDMLDFDYLRLWAKETGVEDILNKTIEETEWQEHP